MKKETWFKKVDGEWKEIEMAKNEANQICKETTQRGGFSEGGGYDRMNGIRFEPCGKPTTIGNACTRHANLRAKNRERVLAFHDEGAHFGGEAGWARQCAKCLDIRVAAIDAERDRERR